MYLAEERRLLELKQRLSDPSTHDTMSRDNAGSNLRLSAIDGMRFLFGER
jgi:hypothetical protein